MGRAFPENALAYHACDLPWHAIWLSSRVLAPSLCVRNSLNYAQQLTLVCFVLLLTWVEKDTNALRAIARALGSNVNRGEDWAQLMRSVFIRYIQPITSSK
jgi:elongation factor P--beta-lysine ligase